MGQGGAHLSAVGYFAKVSCASLSMSLEQIGDAGIYFGGGLFGLVGLGAGRLLPGELAQGVCGELGFLVHLFTG